MQNEKIMDFLNLKSDNRNGKIICDLIVVIWKF